MPARRIDAAAGAVELADGTRLPADSVLIATGGSPRRLAGVRGEGDRVRYLRTLDDARRLREQLRPGARVIVVGAGFVGAEVAAAARAKGAAVTVIEAFRVPLLPLLGREAGAACAELHRAHGTELRLGTVVESVTQTSERVIVTTRDERIEGDLAVIGIGIEPNTDVAARSGISTGNGIVVDEYCRTSLPNVYAAGDVANHYHPVYGARVRVEHFDNASRQAAVAAGNMLGRGTRYEQPHWFWSDQYDVSLQYAGHAAEWDQVVLRGSVADLDFCAFYLRGGTIRAAFGVDRGSDVALARELIAQRRVIESAVLADDDVDLAELAGVGEYA
jgi:3-phenylpropionate/trans-cinnamate dioxygenase ferredoxin reductase subunit